VSVAYIDAIDLRKYLEKKNVKIAQLDTNVVPEEFSRTKSEDKKQARKKRRASGKSNISSDLVALAQLISQSIRLPGDTAPRPTATEEENPEQKKTIFIISQH